MLVLQVGEFVEVSNGSKTDPCGWLGRVSSIGKTFTVSHCSICRLFSLIRPSQAPWQPTYSRHRTKLLAAMLQVKYPFHDTPAEQIKVSPATPVVCCTCHTETAVFDGLQTVKRVQMCHVPVHVQHFPCCICTPPW